MIAPVHLNALPAASPSISKPAVIAAAMMNAVAALLAWAALGSSLQFLIASLLLITLTAPLLQSVGRRVLERAILMQVCCDAVAAVWLIVFLHAGWGIVAWLVAYLLLTGWNAATAGLAMALPDGFEGQVRPRSGLALKHGITCLNTPGTIDSDYRGEVKVVLVNLGTEPFEITRGMRIAQLVVAPVTQATIVEVTSLEETARGSGGFGSTGTA